MTQMMDEAADEVALARIDAALGRIEAVLAGLPPGALPAAVDLAARHAGLRAAVAGVIGRIDALIERGGAAPAPLPVWHGPAA